MIVDAVNRRRCKNISTSFLVLLLYCFYDVGGLGGQGGLGRLCQSNRWEPGVTIAKCLDKGSGSRAANGDRGNTGTPGNSKEAAELKI